MSDPNTESAPQSTAEIVRGVVEQSEAEPVAQEPAASIESGTPPVTQVAEPELSPAEKFLLEKGHKATKEDGRPVWLPHKTVMKMLDDYVGTHRTTWDSSLSTIQQERDKLKADLEELYRDARGENTDLLIQRLAKIDPRYQRYLQPQPSPQPPQPQADFELPAFDLDWNGAQSWTADTFKRTIIPAIVKQARAEAKAEALEAVKPWQQREEEAKRKAEWEQQTSQKHRALMEEAQTWEGFGKFPEDGSLTPFQQQVLDIMKMSASTDLKAAYNIAKRYVQDDTQKRAQFAKEASEAAERATPTITRPGSVPAKVKPKDNRSIVAEIVANSERS